MKIVMLIIATLLLSACTAMNQDFDKYGKNYRKINLHMISVGYDKQQVVTAIGDPTNAIGSKRFENGVVDVWSYEKWGAKMGFDEKEEEYWLYFLNGKLEQWGRPGDWKKEADRIYEVRFR